jgi:serine/threonine-protein kinase
MEKLGRYEILETLGTGSMGVVYKARDTLLYREIALKTIGTGPTVDPELRERFFREARACALLQHPNIVTVFDLGEADNMAYIVMELLQGDDLRRLIEDKRPIPLEARLELMIQVSEALGHAHEHQVIHRDIKPSNIFVQPGNRSKVLDFGIARLPSSKLTLVGRVLGTPNYMAPEQILGQGCDRRSDLFSAAVVFFEFATGVHPFRSSFIPSRIVDGKPDRLRDVNPEMPYALETALARALEKEPDRRYQTGEQFAADLKNALREMLSAIPPVEAAYESPKTRIFRSPAVEAARPAEPEPEPDFGKAPPGQESSEWRVSEFLRLRDEFDTSAAQGDLKGARKAFNYMKRLEGRDPRFGIAALEYANSLRELEERLEPVRPVEPRREPPPERTPEPSVKPAPPSRPPAVRPLETRNVRPEDAPSDQTLPVSLPRQNMSDRLTTIFEVPNRREERRTPPAPRSQTFGPPADITPPPPPPPPVWDPPRAIPPMPPHLPPQTQQPRDTPEGKLKPEQIVIRVALVFLVVLLIAGAGYWYFFSPAEPLPAVGTAEVISPKAAIYEGPSAGKVLYPLAQGNKVNVVRLPRSIRPDWVRVQYISGGKVSPAGFARSAALGNWSTFALLNAFRPDESAGPADVAAYVKSLEHLAMQSPPPDAKNQIWLETAIQSMALARAAQQAGQRPDEWLGHAARALDAIGDDAELGTQVAELRKAVKSFR